MVHELTLTGQDFWVFSRNRIVMPMYDGPILYKKTNDLVPELRMDRSQLNECIGGAKAIVVPYNSIEKLLVGDKIVWGINGAPDIIDAQNTNTPYIGTGNVTIYFNNIRGNAQLVERIRDMGIGLVSPSHSDS